MASSEPFPPLSRSFTPPSRSFPPHPAPSLPLHLLWLLSPPAPAFPFQHLPLLLLSFPVQLFPYSFLLLPSPSQLLPSPMQVLSFLPAPPTAPGPPFRFQLFLSSVHLLPGLIAVSCWWPFCIRIVFYGNCCFLCPVCLTARKKKISILQLS